MAVPHSPPPRLNLQACRFRCTLQVCTMDAYFTDLHWYPVNSKKTQAGGTDIFAVACTDGQCGCRAGFARLPVA